MTRQEMAVFLQRFGDYLGLTVESRPLPASFTDMERAGEWAKDSLLWAYQKSVLNGTAKRVEASGEVVELSPLQVTSRAAGYQAVWNYAQAAGIELPRLGSSSDPDTVVPSVEKDVTTLQIDPMSSFSVTNGEGETLTLDETGLHGDMEVYSSLSVPGGSQFQTNLVIEVPLSETFYFENLTDEDIWVSVSDQYRYARVSGSNLSGFTVDAQGEIVLTGNQFAFSAAYCPGDSTERLGQVMYSATGTGADTVTVRKTEDAIEAIGTVGAYTVTGVKDGEVCDSYEVPPQTTLERDMNP